MRAPIKIAILEADSPMPQTAAKFGSYGGVFTALIEKTLAKLHADGVVKEEKAVELSYYDVVGEEAYPELEDVDAVWITGSRSNAFENTPWIVKLVAFVRNILENQSRVRVVGVCFGHQIIGRALGAKVERNEKGWEAAVTEIQLTAKGKELFKKSFLKIHQMHRDWVMTVPAGVYNLATTDICPVQGFYSPKRLFSTQGHPEFTGEIVEELVEARKKLGIFTGRLYKNVSKRIWKEHDGVVIAEAFLKFLLEE
ncbi:hypothetical protein RUND412_010038 [Rhizina undulata]